MNGTWTSAAIAGKPADVYRLAEGARPRYVVLFLHPYGLDTLVGRAAFTALFDELRLACVCPHAGRSWWADRVCAEFDPALTPQRHLVDQVLPFIAAELGVQPPGVGLLGVSMGGQGALRLAFRHPDRFPVAVGISSAIDFHERYGEGTALDEMYDSKEQARQDTATLHIHPSHYPPHLFFCCDPTDRLWFRGNDRLHEKLSALGVPHECDLQTRAGGHSWSYFDHLAARSVRFLCAGLEQMSRRLL